MIDAHRTAATADLRERFGCSTSDAIAGRLPWRELSDLVNALLVDPSSRLCAAVHKWTGPVNERWLLATVLGAMGAEVRWPWLAAPVADTAEIEAAQKSIRERWG